jgi:hypothetical protein
MRSGIGLDALCADYSLRKSRILGKGQCGSQEICYDVLTGIDRFSSRRARHSDRPAPSVDFEDRLAVIAAKAAGTIYDAA